MYSINEGIFQLIFVIQQTDTNSVVSENTFRFSVFYWKSPILQSWLLCLANRVLSRLFSSFSGFSSELIAALGGIPICLVVEMMSLVLCCLLVEGYSLLCGITSFSAIGLPTSLQNQHCNTSFSYSKTFSPAVHHRNWSLQVCMELDWSRVSLRGCFWSRQQIDGLNCISNIIIVK